MSARSAFSDDPDKARSAIDHWAAALREEPKNENLFSQAYFYLYSPGFWMDVGSLRSGDPTRLETAVVFLEANPWCFHSGYVKARLLRYLKKRSLPVPEPYAERLRRVITTVVDNQGGWEFKWYCRLARKLQTPEFHQQLAERTDHPDPKVRRRAKYLLDYLDGGHL
jgi:hypothetical protein